MSVGYRNAAHRVEMAVITVGPFAVAVLVIAAACQGGQRASRASKEAAGEPS